MKIDVDKALETVEAVPSHRLNAMNLTALIAHSSGQKQGLVRIGGWTGLWEEKDGKPSLYLILREGEKEEDYWISDG